MPSQFSRIFHNWFGSWSARASLSDVVSRSVPFHGSEWSSFFNFQFNKMWKLTQVQHMPQESIEADDWLLCFLHFLCHKLDFRFPFNTNNPIGFLIACGIQYVFIFNLAVATMGIMVIAITPNLILTSIAEDMKSNLDTLNRSAKSKQNADEFIQQFIKFIQFHSNAKQLSASQFSFVLQSLIESQKHLSNFSSPFFFKFSGLSVRMQK